MIRHIHARGVVDRVGVDPAAGERVLDACVLGETEIAALDTDFRAEFGSRNSARVVGVIAHAGVGLGARADVGADTAVVKTIYRRARDRLAKRPAAERLGPPSVSGAG